MKRRRTTNTHTYASPVVAAATAAPATTPQANTPTSTTATSHDTTGRHVLVSAHTLAMPPAAGGTVFLHTAKSWGKHPWAWVPPHVSASQTGACSGDANPVLTLGTGLGLEGCPSTQKGPYLPAAQLLHVVPHAQLLPFQTAGGAHCG